ncbi:MAG TPA: UbiA family prenyltransferase [Acidimicrobiales bacterium]|nr:UbiA family prenyltransferase [Acidimicrobiales bacterium]
MTIPPIDHVRLVVRLSRPPVLILLGLFAATGMAQGGVGQEAGDLPGLAHVLLIVAGFLVAAVAVNDLADADIDAVNLPGRADRPLVAGTATRRDLVVTAVVAATTSLAAAVVLRPAAAIVVAGGLVLALAYSTRPIRLSDRGALTALLLPLGYVAVPFLVGLPGAPSLRDLVLLAGLALGFIGRILLKDFRDVEGDTRYGKRTFLVRHGRRATCATAAAAWMTGSFALVGLAAPPTPALLAVHLAWVGLAIVLLRRLSTAATRPAEERLISAVAIIGRGMVLTLLAHLGATAAGWSAAAGAALLAALLITGVGQARTMVRYGPICCGPGAPFCEGPLLQRVSRPSQIELSRRGPAVLVADVEHPVEPGDLEEALRAGGRGLEHEVASGDVQALVAGDQHAETGRVDEGEAPAVEDHLGGPGGHRGGDRGVEQRGGGGVDLTAQLEPGVTVAEGRLDAEVVGGCSQLVLSVLVGMDGCTAQPVRIMAPGGCLRNQRLPPSTPLDLGDDVLRHLAQLPVAAL